MPSSSSLRVKPVALLLLLCGAGFLGNWLKLSLFFNVDFLFGSFFVMLAVVRFGVLPATLVGIGAASCTWLLWNHPWAIVIFSAEALFVALGNRRKPGRLILLDTLYWLCLGMPLVWYFYHGVMGMTPQATLLVALKQSINGIFNVLLVTLGINIFKLAVSPDYGERKALLSMQEILFTTFVTATLLPAFVYLVVDVRRSTQEDEIDLCRRVTSVGESAQEDLKRWFAVNQQTLIALTSAIGNPNTADTGSMQRHVEAFKLANDNYLRIGVINRRDVTVAFAPLIDELGNSSLGQNFATRPFVRELKQTLQPTVTDVYQGHIGSPGPRLVIAVPFALDGRYQGACSGALDFGKLSEQLNVLVKHRWTDITVLDRAGKIVVSTSDKRSPMEPFKRPPGGVTRQLTDHIYHWLPAPDQNSSVMLRWQRSLVVEERRLSPEMPWTIVVEGSLVPYLNLRNQHSIDMLLMLWGILLLTMIVSHLLSFRIATGLRLLEAATAELPQQLSSGVTRNWPTSNIKELDSLIVNSQIMAGALSSSFQELLVLNQTLEERIMVGTQALRESEEQYRRVVNTANEGIWIANQTLITTYVNQRLAEMLGYSVEEMVGQPITHFIATDHLVDYANRMQSRRLGHSEQFERCMRRRDGTEIWLLLSAAPMLDAEHQLIGTFAMCSDITARKRVERALLSSNELLKKTLASLNEAVFIVQTGTRIIQDCNQIVEKMFGYTREEMIGTVTAGLHVSAAMAQRFTDEMRQQYEEKGYYETTFQMRRKDGTNFDSEHYVSPLRDEQGKVFCHVCVVRDISARKRIEEALITKQGELVALNLSLESRIRQAVDELRQKDQIMITQSRQAAMGEMINNIAHQWRQPLNALGLVLSDIKDAYSFNELDQAYLEQATATGNQLVQQMSSTINDFRNFFRPDKEVVAFSARNQIDAALALVAASFKNDHIAIQLDAPIDFKLLGFPNEYSQVLLNLISNAKEAILAAGVINGRIEIRLEANHEQGSVVIHDNGGGIPTEILPRIFEPYFSSKPLGTGIGLYMSKMIIERNMHGSILARNCVGGAEFTIITPLAKEVP